MSTSCTKCKKSITGTSVICVRCEQKFHPGGARHYVTQRSANLCCVNHFIVNMDDNSAAQISNSQRQSQQPPPWEALLAQVTATSSQLAACIKHQQQINSKLNCLPTIMQALSDHSTRLGALEQTTVTISARLNELESQRAPASFSSSNDLNDLTVSGIPSTISDSPESVVRKVFVALGVEDMFGHVLSVRLMVGKSKAAVNPPRDKNSNATTQFTRLSYIVALSSRSVEIMWSIESERNVLLLLRTFWDWILLQIYL